MRTIITLLLAGVAVAAISTDASAQRRRTYVEAYDTSSLNSLPLTVNRRSWLDSGNAIQSGSTGPSYVAASTGFARTQDRMFSDKFGNSTFREAPYIPARSTPIVSFSTTPGGNVIVDNVYHYQPY